MVVVVENRHVKLPPLGPRGKLSAGPWGAEAKCCPQRRGREVLAMGPIHRILPGCPSQETPGHGVRAVRSWPQDPG
eukprot:9469933-Pyramimonas_sp.AAC.1